MSVIPKTEAIKIQRDGWRLDVTLNRPAARNAMNFRMVNELLDVFEGIAEDRSVRLVVLRGAEGHFCAGGDVKDMAAARAGTPGDDGLDPLAAANRKFGYVVEAIDRAPQAVIAVTEGAVMGGGVGLACAADVTLTRADASFRLPETSLGVPPAQIAPFIVRRIGLTNARRLAVTGGRLDGRAAVEIGFAHECFDSDEDLRRRLDETITQVGRCAPGAVATTKALMLDMGVESVASLLDRGAREFAKAMRSDEGIEGMTAFLEKRIPKWAES
jgi:isohexenylglutaconyl-CoA hydratase